MRCKKAGICPKAATANGSFFRWKVCSRGVLLVA